MAPSADSTPTAGEGGGAGESFQDLLSFAESFFSSSDFEAQPRSVVDVTLDQNAQRLIRIFERVKELPRGKMLKEYPLTMVGISSEEENLISPKIAMCVKRIPHKVLTGDIAKPSAILSALKHRKIDVSKSLFLQVRQGLETEDTVASLSSASQLFARQALAEEKQVSSSTAVFGNLLAAMQRCHVMTENSLGLVLVDLNPLPPVAIGMAAAMAGLFPPDVKKAQPAVREEEGVPAFTQLLVPKEYKVRFADKDDLPALERLEEMAWKKPLRAPPEGLLKRLAASPTTNFAVEVKGAVVAVLYTQRIQVPQDVFKQKFQQVYEGHVNMGRTLQLIAINAHTEHRGLGTELRSFALHLARLDLTLDTVCAVTLCLDYATSGVKNLQQYVDMHVNGRVNDRILTFHTSYGAKVLGLVPTYRPEDTDNEGTGVLIQYKPKEWVYDPSSERRAVGTVATVEKGRKKKTKEPQIPALDILSGIMTDMGYEIDMENLDQGFFASGLDSFDMGVIQNRLGRALGKTLPATLMLDLPTVKELTEKLDKDRGITGAAEGSHSESESTSNTSETRDGSGGSGSRRVSPPAGDGTARKGGGRVTTERGSDDSITEWVRSWRQYLYEKTKVKRAEQRVRSGTPQGRRGPRSLSAGRRKESPWEKMTTEELQRVQLKLTWLLRLPQNQRRLQQVIEKQHESELGLFCDLRPVLDSILGPPLLAMGLVQDTKARNLQDARDDMESRANTLGDEAWTRQKELLSLMKLDHLEPLAARGRSASADGRGGSAAARVWSAPR